MRRIINAYVLVGHLESRDPSEDLGADGKDVNTHPKKIEFEVFDWIHLPLNMNRWRNFVNRVTNIRVI